MSEYLGYETSFVQDRLRGHVTRTTGRGFQNYTTVYALQGFSQIGGYLAMPRGVLRDSQGKPITVQNPDGSFIPIVGLDSPTTV